MFEIEQIRERAVVPLHQLDLQRMHPPADRQPEVISHQHDALQTAAVALSQRLHKFRVLFVPVRVQPLFKLIKNNKDFSSAGLKATLDATTQVDTDGFAPPFSFAEDFPAPGLNRVFNYSELTFEIKDGKLVQDGDEYRDQRLALVPAS